MTYSGVWTLACGLTGARQSTERAGARAGARLGAAVTLGEVERHAGDAGRKVKPACSRKGPRAAHRQRAKDLNFLDLLDTSK